MEKETFDLLKQWLGPIGVCVIGLFLFLHHTGFLGYFSHARQADDANRLGEEKRIDAAQQALNVGYSALIVELRGALSELDVRCRQERDEARNDRAECERRQVGQDEEIARLRRGLAAIMDYCHKLRLTLRAAGHETPAAPMLSITEGE